MFLHTGTKELLETAEDKEVIQSVWLTLWVSFAATFIFSLGAVPLAWFLARKKFPLKNVVQGIIDLPVVLPHTAAGIAILGFISRDGFLGKAAGAAGLSLINNPAGIALAMAFVSLPFLINSARDGFAAVPERLEKAALTLGAVMMFARGMSEFGAVVIVAYHPMIAPVLIYDRFSSFGLKYARPASVFFIIIALAIFIFLRWMSLGKRKVMLSPDAET
jgi:molybdate/tungstate transport system permease protein